MSGYLFLGGV